MFSSYLLFVFLNIVTVVCIFIWVWFIAGKNKSTFSEKLQDVEKKIVGLDAEASVNLQNLQKSLSEELKETKEISKKISDDHEKYHDGMLQKLNQAGELIVGYESFFENSLAELDELSRFVDILSKRPAVSSDPDFTSFVRAVQVMVQILAKYSEVASSLKRGSEVIKTG